MSIFLFNSIKMTMLFLILKCSFISSEIVQLTVICEKVMKDESIRIAEFLVKSALSEYNFYFSKANVEFHLEKILDFEKFSKLKEFSEFSLSMGEKDLRKRKKRLGNISTNLIVLYSTINKVDNKEELEEIFKFSSISPCKGRYFRNIGNSSIPEEIFIIMIDAIKEWIENTFKVELPDILTESRKNIFFVLKHSVREKLKRCNAVKKYVSMNHWEDSEETKKDNDSLLRKYNQSEYSNKIKRPALDVNDDDLYNEQISKKKPIDKNPNSTFYNNRDLSSKKIVNKPSNDKYQKPVFNESDTHINRPINKPVIDDNTSDLKNENFDDKINKIERPISHESNNFQNKKDKKPIFDDDSNYSNTEDISTRKFINKNKRIERPDIDKYRRNLNHKTSRLILDEISIDSSDKYRNNKGEINSLIKEIDDAIESSEVSSIP